MNNVQQCELYAKMIWKDRNLAIRRIAENKKYAVGETNETGSVIEWLTPFMEAEKLLAYLWGYHSAINK